MIVHKTKKRIGWDILVAILTNPPPFSIFLKQQIWKHPVVALFRLMPSHIPLSISQTINVLSQHSPLLSQVSDSGEQNEHSHNALLHVAFPIVLQGRHSRTVISELNTVPMHTPANASPRHYWSSRHSSGAEWIATPKGMGVRPTHFTHLNIHASFGTNRNSA
jgi:hypothetical protein